VFVVVVKHKQQLYKNHFPKATPVIAVEWSFRIVMC